MIVRNRNNASKPRRRLILTTLQDAPFTITRAVTPSNNDITIEGFREYPRGLFIGGAGTLVYQSPNDATIITREVPTGLFPVRVARVLPATTATNIIAGW